ncbi:hypothetical protein ACFV0B_35890 [Streptomyces xanthophaeus]|uniref:hypothetical protein n=1 Tax=Streptomyces xanthophaeus TaxID=67385 RepID=UPI0036B1066D
MSDAKAVVIDGGSGWIKAGVVGGDAPSVFPAVVGASGGHPAERGRITDWAGMEALWEQAFRELGVKSAGQPVLLSEPPLSTRADREKTVRVMFETFDVPACSLVMAQELALYSAGRVTGVVVDVGESLTHVVPVYETHLMDSAVQSSTLAGRDLTARMATLLKADGITLPAGSELKTAREIKEALGKVAATPGEQVPAREYKLRDGTVLSIGSPQTGCPEILFEDGGLVDLIIRAVSGLDVDLRKDMFRNIVLVGGSSQFPGLRDRLVQALDHKLKGTVKTNVIAPEDRQFAAVNGGLALAETEEFAGRWITRAEYDEAGPEAVHDKSA